MYNVLIIIVVSRNVNMEKQLKIKISFFYPCFDKVSAKRYFYISHILSDFPEFSQNLCAHCFRSVSLSHRIPASLHVKHASLALLY